MLFIGTLDFIFIGLKAVHFSSVKFKQADKYEDSTV